MLTPYLNPNHSACAFIELKKSVNFNTFSVKNKSVIQRRIMLIAYGEGEWSHTDNVDSISFESKS